MATLEEIAASGCTGILPSQLLRQAVDEGIVDAGDYTVHDHSIQPGSLDLRLGETAYRVRCSFLPDDRTVAERLKELTVAEVPLDRDGAVLEPNRPYIIPLVEALRLPPGTSGKANPKSSTGRLDVFTRVITDHSHRFDEIAAGYTGPLYLEVVPLSFAVEVRELLALAQLRLSVGGTELTDQELRNLHTEHGLLFADGGRVPPEALATAGGLFMGLDLQGDDAGRVGYRARKNTPVVDVSKVRCHEVADYWDIVYKEPGDRIILDPESFYLLMSTERIRIPPDYAAEMTAYDPTSGELRTHYAGFFDPGFGAEERDGLIGSHAALEVRAHDVPFMVEHGQRVCKLTFSRMLERPVTEYGSGIASNYQHQVDALSKHFVVPDWVDTPEEDRTTPAADGQRTLFDEM